MKIDFFSNLLEDEDPIIRKRVEEEVTERGIKGKGLNSKQIKREVSSFYGEPKNQ